MSIICRYFFFSCWHSGVGNLLVFFLKFFLGWSFLSSLNRVFFFIWTRFVFFKDLWNGHSYFLDCSGLFCYQENCSNFFPETFLLEEKKLTLTLTATLRKNFSNSPEKFFQRVGKIFPESWKNFSGELEKNFFRRVGVKV